MALPGLSLGHRAMAARTVVLQMTRWLQILLNVITFKMNIAQASIAPRIHHQWLPDKLLVETGINQDTRDLLEQKGHQIVTTRAMGSTQSIMKQGNFLYGFSDTRRREALTAGY